MTTMEMNPVFQKGLQEEDLRSFQDFFQMSGRLISRGAGRDVHEIDRSCFRGFLKREERIRWRERLASWRAGFGFVSSTEREWRALHALAECGVEAPEPIARGETGGQAFLLVCELPDFVDLNQYLADGYCETGEERVELARALARALANFHAAGFSHGDLYAQHVLIHVKEKAVAYTDFQRTCRRRRVSWRMRWRDLAALDASLNELLVSSNERLVFLTAYLRAAEARPLRYWWRRSLLAIGQRASRLLRRRRVRAIRNAPLLQYGNGAAAAQHRPARRHGFEPAHSLSGRWD